MSFQTYVNEIALTASFFTIISVAVNVIQFMSRKQENKTLKSQAQENYNGYFLITRACNRARNNKDKPNEEKIINFLRELDYIRGLTDVERNSIISYSREHLKFLPFFEHPAFPSVEASDGVKFGTPPDKIKQKG